jgi:hypothetical protein
MGNWSAAEHHRAYALAGKAQYEHSQVLADDRPAANLPRCCLVDFVCLLRTIYACTAGPCMAVTWLLLQVVRTADVHAVVPGLSSLRIAMCPINVLVALLTYTLLPAQLGL